MTPMMKQYLDIKKKYKDCIVMFRLGDFYEVFFEEAKLVAKELSLTLTGRDCGEEERAAMCGVPHHSVENYIAKLVNKGYKVAICEQLDSPTPGKTIVKRDVVRVVTKGTILDTNFLDEKNNNFISVIYRGKSSMSFAVCDITTGELIASEQEDVAALINQLAKFSPSQIIVNREVMEDKIFCDTIKIKFNIAVEFGYSISFNLEDCSLKMSKYITSDTVENSNIICAVGALFEYIEQTQKVDLSHINKLELYSSDKFMDIDLFTRRNIELTETIREKKRVGSLLHVLDFTETATGARLLKKWIEQPLLSISKIQKRLNAVSEFINNIHAQEKLSECLKNTSDIQRITGKIVFKTITPRDLLTLKKTLSVLPDIKSNMGVLNSDLIKELYNQIDLLTDILLLIENAIEDEAQISIKDGNIIKMGFDKDIDELKIAMHEGKKWLASFEQEEKAKTNIKNLKINFNKVFGYYIEITKSNLKNIPDYYIRKQTLSNCERFTTEKLKEIEYKILTAENNLAEIEYEMFCRVRDKILENVLRIQKTADVLAIIDVLLSLSKAAVKNNYCEPKITNDDKIIINDGRHPVVERMQDSLFIANDTLLDKNDNNFCIVTGPNMAGKSTFMRQVALISIMAQIGSYVPASYASLCLVDKVFTRIGASDDLSSGQSTFMVEMNEVAYILNNATERSLLILDEIGRGTGTFDGLSIAWAVIEYILKNIKAKTLFATHYHELTELEDKLQGIKNYVVAVKKSGDDITFLRKITHGRAEQSFGIEVAMLADIPAAVTKRAKEILTSLEGNDYIKIKGKSAPKRKRYDEDLEIDDKYIDIISKLKSVDLTITTPIEALSILDQLKRSLN